MCVCVCVCSVVCVVWCLCVCVRVCCVLCVCLCVCSVCVLCGVWVFVCVGDSGFISTGAVAYRGSRFGTGLSVLGVSNFQCTGYEERLIDCPSSTVESECETAAVYCFPGEYCSQGIIVL